MVVASPAELPIIQKEWYDISHAGLVVNQRDLSKSSPKPIPPKHAEKRPVLDEKLKKVHRFKRPWTSEEWELAQLLEAEAGTEGFRGKQLVADVVLNRVDSSRFPNSIHKVIFQRYQFSVIGDGRFAKMSSRITEESLKAARAELDGPRLDYGILYFNSGSYCMNGSSPWKYKRHWFAY